MNAIVEITEAEIGDVNGGGIVAVARAVYAAATSSTGKKAFAAGFVAAVAIASDVFSSDDD